MMTRRAIVRVLTGCLLACVLASGDVQTQAPAPPAGLILVAPSGLVRSTGVDLFSSRPAVAPVVDIALTPSGRGYVTLDLLGRIASFGDAPVFPRQNSPRFGAVPVAIVLTATGGGGYVGFADGTVRAIGDAPPFAGPAGGQSQLIPPLVDITLVPGAAGVWALRSDGTVQPLGNAPPLTGLPPASGVAVGIAPTPTGAGAWVAGLDGSVFPLGDASPGRGPRAANAPRVTDIASLGVGGWVVLDAFGRVETATMAPVAVPGRGELFVGLDTLSASSAVTGGFPGLPQTTKVVAASSVLGTTVTGTDGSIDVQLPGFVTSGVTPLEVGDVFATGVGPQTPNGLLRKVTSIQTGPNGSAVVSTTAATLSQAVPSGSLVLNSSLDDLSLPDFEPTSANGSVTPTGAVASASLAPSGARTSAFAAAAVGTPVGTIADPGRFAYGCPSDPDASGVELKATPIFSFDPEIIFSADWADDEAHLRAGLAMQGELGVQVSATGTIACDATFAILDGHSLGKKLIFVGPVPVVVEPKLSLEAKLAGTTSGSVTASASSTGNTSGVLVVDRAPDGQSDYRLDSTFEVQGHLEQQFSGSVAASFTLSPSLGFLLYGVVAPTVELETGLKAVFEPCVNPNLKLEQPVSLTAKLEPSEWLGEMLESLENLDLDVATTFALPGSPYVLATEHIPTPLPCENVQALPNGTTFQPYQAPTDVATPDGATGLVYAVSGGTLPAGLSLSSDGTLSGTPTQSGFFQFDVTVTHSLGSSSQRFRLTVVEDALRFLTTSLPGGVVGDPYSVVLQANRPASDLVWTVTGGAFPAGLSLDPDGALSGTPAEPGVFPVTVRVVHPDSGQAVQQLLSVTVTADVPGEILLGLVGPFVEASNRRAATALGPDGSAVAVLQIPFFDGINPTVLTYRLVAANASGAVGIDVPLPCIPASMQGCAHGIALTPDGGVVVAMARNQTEVVVSRFGPTGATLWEHAIAPPPHAFTLSDGFFNSNARLLVSSAPDGRVAVAASYLAENSSQIDCFPNSESPAFFQWGESTVVEYSALGTVLRKTDLQDKSHLTCGDGSDSILNEVVGITGLTVDATGAFVAVGNTITCCTAGPSQEITRAVFRVDAGSVSPVASATRVLDLVASGASLFAFTAPAAASRCSFEGNQLNGSALVPFAAQPCFGSFDPMPLGGTAGMPGSLVVPITLPSSLPGVVRLADDGTVTAQRARQIQDSSLILRVSVGAGGQVFAIVWRTIDGSMRRVTLNPDLTERVP